MDDFFIFYSNEYKGLIKNESVRYNLKDVEEKKVPYAFTDFFNQAHIALTLSGINHEKIKSEVQKITQDTLSSAIEKISIRRIAKDNSNKSELLETAESYVLYEMMRKYNESYYPTKQDLEKLGIKLVQENQALGNGIGAMLKYKSWVVIKKLSYKDAPDFMIAGTIAGIHDSIINKIYTYLGFEEVKKQAKSSKELPDSIAQAESESGLKRRYKIFEGFLKFGYKPYATLEMLSKAYPQLKPKKPKGRLPKK